MLIKRFFDFSVAITGGLLLLPLILIVALAVCFSTAGPVLYVQDRIGKDGKRFRCMKFRTMRAGADSAGSITAGTDSRITPLGRVLRRYKLDELPQLWHVVMGDMSFVGPRPDVPGYADRLDGEDRLILGLRPGLTGPATLFFRNEETLLARAKVPKRYNDEVIYPMKKRLNLEYVKYWSFSKDIGYILVTVIPSLDRFLKLIPRGVDLPLPETFGM